MSLPILHYREVVKALEKAGFKIVARKGSHIRMKRLRRSRDDIDRIVIIPAHKEIASGTLRHIIDKAGLSREDFVSLL